MNKIMIGIAFAIVSVCVSGICAENLFTPPTELAENSQAFKHYKSGWLDYLGNPTGKQSWEIEAASKAVVEFQKAVEMEPDNKIFHASLAYAFEKTRNIAEVEKHYQEAIQIDPKDAFLHFALGKFYASDTSTKDKAIREFQIAIQIDPDEALFHYHLAYILYQSAVAKSSTSESRKSEYVITSEALAEKALEEIKVGNTRTKYTEYQPPFPTDFKSKMDYIRIISLASAENSAEFEMIRDLSRSNSALAKWYEERHEDRKFLELYQEQITMGKRFAGQTPLSIMKMLVGSAINSTVYATLEKYYSSREIPKGIEWAQNGEKALKEISNLSRKETAEMQKHATPYWTPQEINIKQLNKGDFYFFEAPFVRKMLTRWPDITISTSLK